MPIYVSSAASEAASGSMSAGNIRMSNINMNKYDAAQTMNAGTSTKMSLDYQQTASNQSSVSTGTRNIHDNTDSLKHEGTTFMRNQDGELLRMTGNFEQTGGAWKFSGNVQNLSTGETYTGNMSGMAKDMNSMQQGLNVDDVSMTGKERANLGDVKGKNVAFIQGTVVDSNLSASDIIHKDKTRTENTNDEKNYSYERTTDIDTSRTEKHNNSYSSGDTVTINTKNQIKVGDEVLTGGKITQEGNKAVIEGTTADGMKYTATVGNAEINKDENGNYTVGGQVAQSRKEGGNSTNINNSYSENDSKNIVKGTKISVGDTVNDYTGAINLVNDGITKHGAHQGSMREALVDNMTKYQNSIMSEQGKNQLSLDKAFGIAGDASGSAGFKILGTGVQASVSAELSAIAKEGSGQVSSADLNRVMNSAILEQLDIDAKNNNWTAEQYDQAARERFGAYNNYLKEQAGQSFGPSDEDLAPIKKAEELGQKTEQVVNKLLK